MASSGQFNLKRFNTVVNQLANEEVLPPRFRDHQLKGELKDFRECHLEPDLLLIYSKEEKILTLFLFRIGSHSELFE